MGRAGFNGGRIMTDNSNEGAKITNYSKDTRLDTSLDFHGKGIG